jgi:hypothetical protein
MRIGRKMKFLNIGLHFMNSNHMHCQIVHNINVLCIYTGYDLICTCTVMHALFMYIYNDKQNAMFIQTKNRGDRKFRLSAEGSNN